MSFDVFGDFETQEYLRNFEAKKTIHITNSQSIVSTRLIMNAAENDLIHCF